MSGYSIWISSERVGTFTSRRGAMQEARRIVESRAACTDGFAEVYVEGTDRSGFTYEAAVSVNGDGKITTTVY